MNIMLVSVTERTREIGLRMAVGAWSRDILQQFLAESVILCFCGGAVGILVGRGISMLVRMLLRWPTELSIGAIVAAFAVSVTVGIVFGFYPAWKASRLDPIIALLVAANIVRTGTSLVRDSMSGLMDKALPADEMAAVNEVLARHSVEQAEFHALRTRKSGRRSFISIHVLVPGGWTVQEGHDFAEKVEHDLREAVGQATVFTHLEPVEDPLSFADTELDRTER